MNKKIVVSAPGKLMLFGEHAVVYGRPCIVTAVGQRMKATVEITSEPIFELNAPDVKVENYKKPMSELGKGDPSTGLRLRGRSDSRSSGQGIPKGAKFVEIAIKNFFTRHPRSNRGSISIDSRFRGNDRKERGNDSFGIKITTKSEFNSQFGFGGSSASTVCVIKALSELLGAKLNNRTIFKLAYKTVLDIQGVASGFDVAAATYGGTLYYVIGGKVIKPLNLPSLPLIVGYSGVKADTVTLVNFVKEKAKKYPHFIENAYDQMGQIADLAKKALLKGDFQTVGELMNFNQGLLSLIGVSSDKLETMIYAAREAGAYGAKLSGAGVGDCMLALTSPKNKRTVEEALNKAGGQVISIKAHVEGVRIER